MTAKARLAATIGIWLLAWLVLGWKFAVAIYLAQWLVNIEHY